MTTLDFIGCAKCGEPLDGEKPNCPMCGELVSPETVTELELPKPEELVIEEQTRDHLRFRLPFRSLDNTLGQMVITFTCGGFVVANLLGILSFRVYNLYWVAILLYCPIPCVYIGMAALHWRGYVTIELTRQHLRMFYHLGRLGLSMKVATSHISQACLIIDCGIVMSTLEIGRRKIILTRLHPPETARFVTQLIRRQLKSMGHELADS